MVNLFQFFYRPHQMELGDGDILIDGTWPWLGLHGQGEDRVGPAAHLRSKVFHKLPITNQGNLR